jgi:glycosyltransferase involved in cell wall biosynthesis
MSILLVGSYPPPHGGQSVHIRNLGRYLATQGHDVRILNTGSNKEVREVGVTNIASARQLFSHLLAANDAELVHVHVSTAEDYGKLVPVGVAAKLRRFPWVVTVHSGASAGRLRDLRGARRLASRALLAGARSIVCVNDALRDAIGEELGARFGRSKTSTIVPFSVDFSASPLPAEVEGFFTEHSPVIACVGLYEPTYGFCHAIRLLDDLRERHPRAGLVLIGDRQGDDGCRELIGALRLTEDVQLCGNLDHDGCLATLRRATLFLRPTRFDGDSLSVREALALGVPVVASETDFRPPGVVLYDYGDFDDLVMKVEATLARADPAQRQAALDCKHLEQVRELYLRITHSEDDHVRNLRQAHL